LIRINPGGFIPAAPTDDHDPMVSTQSKQVFIVGMTAAGRAFRPSDWAERLAGVMSPYRPGGVASGRQISYSPWCVPTTVCGVRSVVVHADLRDAHVMAWDFCLNFAKDNELLVFHGKQPTPDQLPGRR
jgi:hypothetical protein